MTPHGRPEKAALVLGATGHVGQAIVRTLLEDGYSVTAATRQKRPASLTNLSVVIASGDAMDPGRMASWVEGHDLVVDAAAPRPLNLFVSEGREGLQTAGYARHRTKLLLDAVSRNGARLVFVSSSITLSRSGSLASRLEGRSRRIVYPYFRAKQLMEAMVLEAAANGLPAVVVNPGAFLGPFEYRSDTSLVHLVLTTDLPAAVSHVVNVIDVRDVATGILAAVDQERYGVQIPLSGHNVGMDLLTAKIAAIGGVRPARRVMEVRVAELGAYWGEWALALTGTAPPRWWQSAALIADAVPMSPSLEQVKLGLQARPLDTTLVDSVDWHRRRSGDGDLF